MDFTLALLHLSVIHIQASGLHTGQSGLHTGIYTINPPSYEEVMRGSNLPNQYSGDVVHNSDRSDVESNSNSGVGQKRWRICRNILKNLLIGSGIFMGIVCLDFSYSSLKFLPLAVISFAEALLAYYFLK